jgi:hypothetical protein
VDGKHRAPSPTPQVAAWTAHDPDVYPGKPYLHAVVARRDRAVVSCFSYAPKDGPAPASFDRVAAALAT